jgi:hypothetical protein
VQAERTLRFPARLSPSSVRRSDRPRGALDHQARTKEAPLEGTQQCNASATLMFWKHMDLCSRFELDMAMHCRHRLTRNGGW